MGTDKKQPGMKPMVPPARLERALPKKTDFESVASTNSATGAKLHRQDTIGIAASVNRQPGNPVYPLLGVISAHSSCSDTSIRFRNNALT